MKKAGTVLNLQNDIEMFNEDMESNGHYAINILPDEAWNFDNIEQVLIFEDESDKSKIQKITKLHKQFGHASSRNLENLLK